MRPVQGVSFFFLLCFGILLTSCQWARSTDDAVEPLPEAAFIQFYVLKISRDSQAALPRSQVELLRSVNGKGQMKWAGPTDSPNKDYLTVYRCAGKKIMDSVVVAHPLFLHVEYADETGRYATKDVVLDSAQFFFRLPGRRDVDNLQVLETLKGSAKTKLGGLKIL